ncbi:MAG: hypothetical protein EXS47_01355 [Candidatus Zambryskibacteria bacterium]|nr:hypothetical protein [Candidatus Zambryskibacteria bacterium]
MSHKIPSDMKEALCADSKAISFWESITPLARNEWICWVIAAVKPETRKKRIERTRVELKEGKRRPCCWAGCIHR